MVSQFWGFFQILIQIMNSIFRFSFFFFFKLFIEVFKITLRGIYMHSAIQAW